MKRHILPLALVVLVSVAASDGCDGDTTVGRPVVVDTPTDPEGLTVEQRNVRDRLIADNKPGSIKHLYVISAYSGQVLIYSTVRGKVTSSGKRLTPTTLTGPGQYGDSYVSFNVRGTTYRTPEMISDDGTYGSSVEYLYWWDAQGRYHQHYVAGGQILHISDQPLNVRGVVLNMELSAEATR